MTPSQFELFRSNAVAALLAEQTSDGHWVGELSTSALSTATAVFALNLFADPKWSSQVQAGLGWLATHQNPDGGWGDTTKSVSNLSTTCLAWAALNVSVAQDMSSTACRAEAWILGKVGTLNPKQLSTAIADRYGNDRTFSVPILTMLALAGRLGNDPWQFVPQLPFELAALPFWCFQVLRLPVVSYALPALIAIGQVKHSRRPSWNPLMRALRWAASKRTLRKLAQIQPTTGGYLEATPLTAFVCMSLIGAGQRDDAVVRRGLDFLVQSMRPDGGWPIDTNLTTWVTTLAISALHTAEHQHEATIPNKLKKWILAQQYRETHPYTMAAPGGWAWTNLSGGVPDADDTPSALLALAKLGEADDITVTAAEAGVNWLLDLQNHDGGIPTFCRGWTGLPFDRSSNDLTAHAILAWSAWRSRLPAPVQRRIELGIARGIVYLMKTQRHGGAWAPLWFGNQHAAEISNLTYGTSRVLRLVDCEQLPAEFHLALRRAANWLMQSQNLDGGWGGRTGTPSSIEETALALEGLAGFATGQNFMGTDVIPRAVNYLAGATQNGKQFPAEPIGFYFANLWYFEKLYPIIDTVAALGRIANVMRRNDSES
jgi:squalene-hopene/tetraprenyl-beta-curcumene cyclase